MRLIQNQWIGPPDIPESELNRSIAERVLLSRGFSREEDRVAFLSEREPVCHDPFLLPDMDLACSEICRAVQAGQKILIYGDYDADGITATAILFLFLRKIGAQADYIIPDRGTEGYGISETLFEDIYGRAPDLLITVDCGIANIEEIARLSMNGVNVIVTDHHEVKEELPDALAVVSAKRADSEYPFPHLCGAGIALKLIQGICQGADPYDTGADVDPDAPGVLFREGFDGLKADTWKEYTDLAAIGTIADVVPLIDENRSIVRSGLLMLEQRRRPGIQALVQLVIRDDEPLTSFAFSYRLVPKINAAGRMGDAARAVELMISDDRETAEQLARELIEENTRRQEIEAVMLEEAILQVNGMIKKGEWTYGSPLVVRGEAWHPGIIGILASRLVRRFRCSAIVFTDQSGRDGYLKASARASSEYNILNAITYAEKYIDQFGGHPKAAGVAVRKENYDGFSEAIREYASRIAGESGEQSIRIDAEVSGGDLTLDSLEALQVLQPFGEGNREPIFLLRKARVEKVSLCGQDKHLKLSLLPDKDAGANVDAIAFGFGDRAAIYTPGRFVDAVFSLRANTWMGRKTLSLNILDLRLSREGHLLKDAPDVPEKLYASRLPIRQIATLAKRPISELLPQKEDVKNVYMFLKNRCGEEVCECDAHLLALMINAEYQSNLHAFSLMRVFDVFEEAGLLSVICKRGIRVCFHLLFVSGKVKLENTETFRRIFDREGQDR